jgi:putative transposase
MPRTSREKSETGIYHIMMRGIDKRNIFIFENDYWKFLECIKKAKEKSDMSLLAYCFMTNHVHLLIKEGHEEIGDTIRRINVGYAQYHNKKHGRTGHLFQNRYQSEPINDDAYLLVVLRYIHQNPVKAKMVSTISDYKWSSYNDYLSRKISLTDTDIITGYFDSTETFVNFHNQKNNDFCLDSQEVKRYTDDELRQVINKITEIEKLKLIGIDLRATLLQKIKSETGASNRQLERVLGIGRSIIQKA